MNKSDQRMTRQRQVILEEVRRTKSHPTADEVYEMVRRRLPRISLGTVYRNLERLSREGLIRTIEGGGQRRYDGELQEHAHIRCTGCGVVGDAGLTRSMVHDRSLNVSGGFSIAGYRLEYFGLCSECQKEQ